MDKSTYQMMNIRMRKDQHHLLKQKSKKQKIPMSVLVRIAVDNYLGVDY
jgi:hypothetical protein